MYTDGARVLYIVVRSLPQLATTLDGLSGIYSTSLILGLARGKHRVTGDGCSRASGTAWMLNAPIAHHMRVVSMCLCAHAQSHGEASERARWRTSRTVCVRPERVQSQDTSIRARRARA